MKDYHGMNKIFEKYFATKKPARATAGVKFVGDFKIEIEAIAYIP
jgi:enamine deaminase RidA (YjgF/YER057c/UK114 family)